MLLTSRNKYVVLPVQVLCLFSTACLFVLTYSLSLCQLGEISDQIADRATLSGTSVCVTIPFSPITTFLSSRQYSVERRAGTDGETMFSLAAAAAERGANTCAHPLCVCLCVCGDARDTTPTHQDLELQLAAAKLEAARAEWAEDKAQISAQIVVERKARAESLQEEVLLREQLELAMTRLSELQQNWKASQEVIVVLREAADARTALNKQLHDKSDSLEKLVKAMKQDRDKVYTEKTKMASLCRALQVDREVLRVKVAKLEEEKARAVEVGLESVEVAVSPATAERGDSESADGAGPSRSVAAVSAVKKGEERERDSTTGDSCGVVHVHSPAREAEPEDVAVDAEGRDVGAKSEALDPSPVVGAADVGRARQEEEL
jgi:hypothetical protein